MQLSVVNGNDEKEDDEDESKAKHDGEKQNGEGKQLKETATD